jgi:hypothetical protein
MFRRIKIGKNTALTSDLLNLDQLVKPDLAKAKYIEIGIEHLQVEEAKDGKTRPASILPEILVKHKMAVPAYGYNFLLAFHPKAPWSSTIIEGQVGRSIFEDFHHKKVDISLPYVVRVYEIDNKVGG